MKLFVDYSKTEEIWNLISVGHVYKVISLSLYRTAHVENFNI